MEYMRCLADSCLHFNWINISLIIWFLWVDDCLIVGPQDLVLQAKSKMTNIFECDGVEEMNEYVGCKIERDSKEGWIKLAQRVLFQSYEDELSLDMHRGSPRTPAKPVSSEVLSKGEMMNYILGVGKLLHMELQGNFSVWPKIKQNWYQNQN